LMERLSMECRARLIVCKGFLTDYRALSVDYRDHLTDSRALLAAVKQATYTSISNLWLF